MMWLALILLAVVFGGARSIMDKKFVDDPLEYLVVRGGIISILVLFLTPWVTFSIEPLLLTIIAANALVAVIGWEYQMKSMKHTDISIVEPLMNLTPLVVLVFSFLTMGETVSLIEFGGIMLIVLGTYVLEMDHTHSGIFGPIKKMMESKYITYLLVSIFLFGICFTIDRYMLVNHMDTFSYIFYLWIFMFLGFLALYFMNHDASNLKAAVKKQAPALSLPAMAHVAAFIFFYLGMELAPAAGLAVAIFRLRSLITTIEGGLMFHEKHLMKNSLACTIMVFGTALLVL